MNNVFKSKKHAIIAVILGVFITLAYKLWKSYLRNSMGLDPQTDYYSYEMMNTVLRYLGAVLSFVFCYKLYSCRSLIYQNLNQKAQILPVAYLFGYILLQIIILEKPTSSWGKFNFELFVNFAVGFWEEFAFRGIIFAGLCSLISFNKAIVLSSLYFSLWHIDVYSSPGAFAMLFFAGVVFASLFSLGTSLVTVSLIHFLWDQFHFAVTWRGGDFLLFEKAISVYQLLFALVMFWLANKKITKKQGLS